MATATTATEVLKPSAEKTNYTKLARLLICGGTKIVREVFDNIIPPAKLKAKLKDPTALSRLSQMREDKILTFPQWEVLFPPSGTYGKSESFDITLLFKLLREFGGLSKPRTGWDKLPDDKDLSLSADLARIKYYRNEICHKYKDLGINNDEFKVIWERTENALLRMVGSSKTTDWKKEIDNLLTGPLTEDDEINIKELESWYRHDMEIKAMLEAMPDVIMERLEAKFVLQSKDCQKNNYGERLVKFLREYYRNGERALILPFPWMEGDRFHIEKLYTSLRMVDKGNKLNKLEVGTLFSPLAGKSRAVRRVVIEGEPGMGKSTFSKKIAYDWSMEKLPLPDVDLVLVVKCCDLKDGDLWQAIKEQNLPEDLYEKDKEVFNYIRDNQHKILLILDGFDEIPATASVMKQSILELVAGRLLPNSRVIVTSRPEKCSAIRKHFDKKLEINGFFLEDSYKFIKQFFHSSSHNADAAENVVAQIKSREAGTTRELICSPLHAAFLCLILEEKKDSDFFKSLDIGTLYREIVFCVIKRYCVEKKGQEVEDDTLMAEYHEVRVLLGKIALDFIKRNLTSFGEEEFPANSKQILLDIGFLNESTSLNEIRPKSTYRFSHESIKDYFAAFYVVESLRKGNIDVLKSIRNFTVNPSASCVKNANHVQNVYYSLQRFDLAKMARLSSSNDYVRLINGLTSELPNDIDVTQTELVKFDFIFSFICELLGKCPAELLTEVINKIEIPDLPLVLYLYNGRQALRGFLSLLSHAKEETSKVKIQDLRFEGFQAILDYLSAEDIKELTEALGEHKHLNTIYFSFFSCSKYFSIFFKNFSSNYIKSLGISYIPQDVPTGSDGTFTEILKNLRSLKSLHVFNSSMDYECYDDIAEGLSMTQSLRVLKLHNCNLGSHNVHCSLRSLLKSSHTLQELDLSGNDFSDVHNLHVRRNTLQVLRLNNCNLGSHNVDSILSSLLMKSHTLKELDLSGNDFSDLHNLKVMSNTLQVLRMRNCNLGSHNVHSILSPLLMRSHTLKELDLSGNDFSDLHNLKVRSNTLQVLRMRNCNLGLHDDSILSSLHAISHAIKELDLSGNVIDPKFQSSEIFVHGVGRKHRFLIRDGSQHDCNLPDRGIAFEVPLNAFKDTAYITCETFPYAFPPPARKDLDEVLVSDIVVLGSDISHSGKPLVITLMHSGADKALGYETVVKAVDIKHERSWIELEEHKSDRPKPFTSNCIQVQIKIPTTLAVVSRLITDRFEVTPDKRCVVTSSVSDDITVEFPEGAVDKTVKGTMKLLFMPKNIHHVKHACPILCIGGFAGVTFAKSVLFKMPSSKSEYQTNEIRLLRLDEPLKNEWEDITDDVHIIEHEIYIEFQVKRFSCLWPWKSSKNIRLAATLFQYLRSPPQAVCFAAFKDDNETLCRSQKLTLVCVANHKQYETESNMKDQGYKRMALSTADHKMRPNDEAYTRINGAAMETQRFFLRFLKKEVCRKELQITDTRHEEENQKQLVLNFFPNEEEDCDLLLCSLQINKGKIFPKLVEHIVEEEGAPLEGAVANLPSEEGGDEDVRELVLALGDDLSTVSAAEVAELLPEYLNVGRTMREDPPPDVIKKCHQFCRILKTKGRKDIVEALRHGLPSGMTGPLLDGDILIRNLDDTTKTQFSRALTVTDKWRSFAEKIKGITMIDINFYSQKKENPVLGILDNHCGNMTIDTLYRLTVESGANAIADRL